MHCCRGHLEKEEELVCLRHVPCYLREVLDFGKPVVDEWITLLLHFSQAIGEFRCAHQADVDASFMHSSFRKSCRTLCLPNGPFVDCTLELWRLDQLVDDLKVAQGEELLGVPLDILY